MWILIAFSFVSSAVGFLPCQRQLEGAVFRAPDGERIRLKPDQIVLSGDLESYDSQGSAQAWCLTDSLFCALLGTDSEDALFMINPDDHVYLFKADGRLDVSGYHASLNSNGLQRPGLVTEFQGYEPAIEPSDYEQAFYSRRPAVVIHRPPDLAYIDHLYGDKLRRYREQLRRTIERPSLQFAIASGTPVIDADGKFSIETPRGNFRPKLEDELIFIDEVGRLISQYRIENYPLRTSLIKNYVDRAKRCVLARRSLE